MHTDQAFKPCRSTTAGSTSLFHVWQDWFDDAFAGAPARRRTSLPGPGQELATAAWPLVEAASEAVSARLLDLEAAGLLDATGAMAVYGELTASLWTSLFGAMSRTMVLELAAAQSITRPGEQDDRDRYDLLVECLADPEFALAILRPHDDLCRLVAILCRNWSTASADMLRDLLSDWQCMKSRFHLGDDEKVASAALSQGDTHRNGRAVAIVTLASGRRLVYKPRPMRAEISFAAFADWFNRCAGEKLLAAVDSLDRGDHGWSGFVDHHAARDRAAVGRYHFRLGALVAVSRVLGLTDLHYENLVAHGEWPVVIDLETLFHPPTEDLFPRQRPTPADSLLARIADASVMASGLLPNRVPAGATDLPASLAGMSDVEGMETAFDLPLWEDAGTGRMRLVEVRHRLHGGGNLPVWEGRRVAPEQHCDSVIAGFERAYAILLERQDELLAPEGPLARFADAPVRVVLRPTQHYLDVLGNASHPQLLADRPEKEAWLRGALPVEGRRHRLAALAASEIAAVWRNDVPYFETVPASRDLRGCDGRTYEAILPRSGMSCAAAVLRGLGEADLRLQVRLIRTALTKAGIPLPGKQGLALPYRGRRPTATGAAETIAAIAAREICASAIVDQGSAAWFTVVEGTQGTLVSTAAGLDLYSGLPGMALFLSHAGYALGDREAHDVARAATVGLLAAIAEGAHEALPIGGHAGLGGLAFALRALQKRHRDLPVGQAIKAVHATMRRVDLDAAPLELMTGLAGAILALAPDAEADGLTTTLVGVAVQRVGDLTRQDAVFGVGGFAHGVAGLSTALTTGATLLRDDTRRAQLSDAVATITRRHASRPPLPDAHCDGMSWCGGHAGRLIAQPRQSGPARSDLAGRIATALKQDAFGDDSLCHGSLGALMVLRRCGADGDVAAAVLERIAERGPRCGTIGGAISPALMDGLAGIGLAALELGCGVALPCGLTFAAGGEQGRGAS